MAPRGGWFSRNWKWAVPVGCLGIIASCICMGAIAGFMGFNAIKNNTAYVQALAIAMSDDEVQATLGTPIDTSFMGQQSSVKIEGGRSVAQFAIPLKGSKAEGLLRVNAVKTGEEWNYQVFQVDVPGRDSIDLLHKVGGTPREQQMPPTGGPPGDRQMPPAGGPPGGRQMAPPTPDAPPPAGNTGEAQPEDEAMDEAADEAADEAQGGDGDAPM